MKINSLKNPGLPTLVLALIFCLFFGACDKQETPLPYNNLEAFFKAKAPKKQLFTIDPSLTQTITGAQGTNVTFFSNSFTDATGALVTTPVQVQLIEIFKKGDMILSEKMTSSYGYLLESGGEFFLKATSGGQEVFLNQDYQMIVPIVAATSNPSAMELFVLNLSLPDSATWIPADSSSWVSVDTSGTIGGQTYPNYNFYFDGLTWINCDYFWPNTSPRINLNIEPALSDVLLTSVRAYLVFNSLNAVLPAYAQGTSLKVSNVPTGETATIVIIGMNSTQFYVGTKAITITNSNTITVPMSAVSEAQLISTINGL